MARSKKNSSEQDESTSVMIEERPQEKSVENVKKIDVLESLILPSKDSVGEKTSKEVAKEKLGKMIKEETRTVRGRFRNYETPGGNLRVQIRKYPNIPAFDKVMEDNQTYEVPLYVARHLNGVDASAENCNRRINTCAWPTHGFKYEGDKPANCRENGGIPVPIIGIQKWNRRFGFESLEFDTTV